MKSNFQPCPTINFLLRCIFWYRQKINTDMCCGYISNNLTWHRKQKVECIWFGLLVVCIEKRVLYNLWLSFRVWFLVIEKKCNHGPLFIAIYDTSLTASYQCLQFGYDTLFKQNILWSLRNYCFLDGDYRIQCWQQIIVSIVFFTLPPSDH